MITTMAPPTQPPITKCSDDNTWFLYEDHCYKFYSDVDEDPVSYWEAHKLCRNEGGELVSIHTLEENYWIESMVGFVSRTSVHRRSTKCQAVTCSVICLVRNAERRIWIDPSLVITL